MKQLKVIPIIIDKKEEARLYENKTRMLFNKANHPTPFRANLYSEEGKYIGNADCITKIELNSSTPNLKVLLENLTTLREDLIKKFQKNKNIELIIYITKDIRMSLATHPSKLERATLNQIKESTSFIEQLAELLDFAKEQQLKDSIIGTIENAIREAKEVLKITLDHYDKRWKEDNSDDNNT